jgi:hypothetical protein
MSEYVTVEARPTNNPDVLEIVTNQTLTSEVEEIYHNVDEGDEGSPIAQMLFSGVEGILALTITPNTLIIRRDSETPWEALVDEVRDALRDFFL